MTRNPLNKLTQYENPEDNSKLRPISIHVDYQIELSNFIIGPWHHLNAHASRVIENLQTRQCNFANCTTTSQRLSCLPVIQLV